MAELKSTEVPAFLARAKVQNARTVEAFFLAERRNEWVNWDGDTDVVSRSHSNAHPSAELAEAQAERSRVQGSVFEIRHTIALSVECDRGELLIYQVFGPRPLAPLLDEISAIGSVKNLPQWLSKAVERKSVGRTWLKLSCYEKREMAGFKTYRPSDTFSLRTSRAGGRKNGLAWTLRPVSVDASAVDLLAAAINARLIAERERGETGTAAGGKAETAGRVPGAAETRTRDSAPGAAELALETRSAQVIQAADTAPQTRQPLDSSSQVSSPEVKQVGDAPDDTVREQVALARVGQGLFRRRLEAIEKACRLTGVTHKSHLRASHIKPWRDSNADERLDGNNGLLLSPHVDHLFDAGYISFTDDGRMLVGQELDRAVLLAWHIDPEVNVGPFNVQQCHYLEYHRANVFRT